MAGLNRLHAGARYTVPFSIDDIVPAVGQGALAIETRAGDEHVASLLHETIDDHVTALCVKCERAALRTLRAGCSAPIGVHATLAGGTMTVHGFHGIAGAAPRRVTLHAKVDRVADAESLGLRLAESLAPPLAGRVVVVPRTQPRPSRIAGALRELGAEVVELKVGDAWPDPAERIPDMVLFPSSGSVTAAEPYLSRLRQLDRKPLVTAMGPQTREAAEAAGFVPDAVSETASIEAVVGLARRSLERR
jgi:hypothetical protein